MDGERFIGVCKYCGKTRTVISAECQREADETATQLCTCDEGARERALFRAERKIAEICSENGEVIRDFLLYCAQFVGDDTLLELSVKIDTGEKVKIKKSSKGSLTITKTVTETRERVLA